MVSDKGILKSPKICWYGWDINLASLEHKE